MLVPTNMMASHNTTLYHDYHNIGLGELPVVHHHHNIDNTV